MMLDDVHNSTDGCCSFWQLSVLDSSLRLEWWFRGLGLGRRCAFRSAGLKNVHVARPKKPSARLTQTMTYCTETDTPFWFMRQRSQRAGNDWSNSARRRY